MVLTIPEPLMFMGKVLALRSSLAEDLIMRPLSMLMGFT